MQNTCRNIPVMTLLNTINCFLDFSFVFYVHVAPESQTFHWLLKFSVLHSMGIFQVLTLTNQYFSQLFYNCFYLLMFDLGGWYFHINKDILPHTMPAFGLWKYPTPRTTARRRWSVHLGNQNYRHWGFLAAFVGVSCERLAYLLRTL